MQGFGDFYELEQPHNVALDGHRQVRLFQKGYQPFQVGHHQGGVFLHADRKGPGSPLSNTVGSVEEHLNKLAEPARALSNPRNHRVARRTGIVLKYGLSEVHWLAMLMALEPTANSQMPVAPMPKY